MGHPDLRRCATCEVHNLLCFHCLCTGCTWCSRWSFQSITREGICSQVRCSTASQFCGGCGAEKLAAGANDAGNSVESAPRGASEGLDEVPPLPAPRPIAAAQAAHIDAAIAGAAATMAGVEPTAVFAPPAATQYLQPRSQPAPRMMMMLPRVAPKPTPLGAGSASAAPLAAHLAARLSSIPAMEGASVLTKRGRELHASEPATDLGALCRAKRKPANRPPLPALLQPFVGAMMQHSFGSIRSFGGQQSMQQPPYSLVMQPSALHSSVTQHLRPPPPGFQAHCAGAQLAHAALPPPAVAAAAPVNPQPVRGPPPVVTSGPASDNRGLRAAQELEQPVELFLAQASSNAAAVRAAASSIAFSPSGQAGSESLGTAVLHWNHAPTSPRADTAPEPSRPGQQTVDQPEHAPGGGRAGMHQAETSAPATA